MKVTHLNIIWIICYVHCSKRIYHYLKLKFTFPLLVTIAQNCSMIRIFTTNSTDPRSVKSGIHISLFETISPEILQCSDWFQTKVQSNQDNRTQSWNLAIFWLSKTSTISLGASCIAILSVSFEHFGSTH